MPYGFRILVRLGERRPGDEATFTSEEYASFKEAYEGLVNFDFDNTWDNLRVVRRVEIYMVGGKPVPVLIDTGFAIAVPALHHLNVTEAEFDDVIFEVSGEEADETTLALLDPISSARIIPS